MIVHAIISAHGRLRQEDREPAQSQSRLCIETSPKNKIWRGAGGRHGISNSVEFYRVEMLILGKVTSLW